MRNLLLPLLALLPGTTTAASSDHHEISGHGARSVHPINERYMAVADSNVDSILIVDGNSGGAVVGHFVLHKDTLDSNPTNWMNPKSIATCDVCNHIFVNNNSMLFAIALDKPLLDMANEHDFSSLSKSTVRPFWPENWSDKYKGDGYLRQVSVAYDGSSAYLAHAMGGIFSFDPLEPTDANRKAQHVIKIGDADIGDNINGIHHTSSLKNLVITRDNYVHIAKLMDDDGENPIENGRPRAYTLSVNYHCDSLYDDEEMTFVDTVIINEYAFLLGHPTHSSESKHNGVSIYRLTWFDEDEAWHDCVQVAGDGLKDAGWVDGPGRESRFSATPTDLSVLPTSASHTVVVADTDNRAIRYVDVTIPVESHKHVDKVRVSSIAYDEDLYQVLYNKDEPWTGLTPESVMAQDGKSYYHSGKESIYSMDFDTAQDECQRVGIGRVCTLPEIRARFARGMYPTLAGDDSEWTTVWTAEQCRGCHLEDPGKCALGDSKAWGSDSKMIAVFNPEKGLQTQCVESDRSMDTFSMCCGLGGPAVLNPQPTASEQAKKAAGISFGVIIPMLVVAVAAYALYMRKKAKPSWWPKFLRNDQREETGHAPHREVDLRGRDYI